MPLLLDAGRRANNADAAFGVRSVVPGRQRWEVAHVLGRPQTAVAVEAALRRVRGITHVRANPVTGRVLVRHDRTLDAAKIGRALRAAVARARRGPALAPSRERNGVRRGAVVLTSAAAVVRRRLLAVVAPVFRGVLALVRRGLGMSAGGTGGGRRWADHPLARVIGRHRRRLAEASVLSVLCQFAEMALGVFLGWIALVLIKGEFAPLTRLGVIGASSQLWALAGAAAVACGIVGVLAYTSSVRWRRLGQAVQRDWRGRLHRHVQHLELLHVQEQRPTTIASVLTDDVDQLGLFFAASANDVLQLATSVLVLVPAFLVLAPSVAWIAFLPMPFVALMSLRHRDRSAADYAASAEHRATLRSRLVANLEAAATVKSACAEDHEVDRVDQLDHECEQVDLRTDRHTIRHAESIRAWTTASMTGTLLMGGRLVLNGTLPFEVFSPLIGLPQQTLLRLTRLGACVDQYQRTLASFDRVQHLFGLPVEPAGGRRPARVDGDIVLDRVSFSYPGRLPVLETLSLRVASGKVTGIVGATGSGKTTIARLLMRFQDVEFGRVLLDGVDVRGLSRRDLRGAIGFVAQDSFLFDGTIADNIRYGTFDASDEQVCAAARTAEAHDFIEALPAGYDTVIGEHGAALSGGQRQRVALARAVLKDPPVVILDEATSAVDNETEAAIQRALATFGAGRTMIVIAHRLSTIRQADHIYVLDRGGVIAEQGTHGELLSRSGLYSSLWELQAGAQV